MKRVVFFIALFFIVLLLNGETIQKKFPINPGKPVSVSFQDVDGDLTVEAQAINEIVFEFRKEFSGSRTETNLKYFQGITPDIRFADNRLEVQIEYPEDHNIFSFFNFRRMEVKTILRVPLHTDVEVHLVDGDADIRAVQGKIYLKAVDGDLQLASCQGEIDLHSVDGNIEVRNGRGQLRLGVVDGDVFAEGVWQNLEYSAVDGDGELRCQEGSKMEGDWRLRSTDGNIRLYVPRSLAFSLRARTDDGDISSNIQFSRRNDERGEDEERLEGEKGSGGRLLDIRSSEGDITINEE